MRHSGQQGAAPVRFTSFIIDIVEINKHFIMTASERNREETPSSKYREYVFMSTY